MSLRSRSFLLGRNDPPDSVSKFLDTEIGLDAHLIKGLQTVSVSPNTIELTVLYSKYDDDMLSSVAPYSASFMSDELSGNNFDLRFLFSHPIDASSLVTGSLVVDGTGLIPPSKYHLDPTCNNYYLKVNLSGYSSNSYHDYRFDNSKLLRKDGSKFDHTYAGSYSLFGKALGNTQSESQPPPIRGKIAVDVIRNTNSNNYQQVLQNFIRSNSITEDMLIRYSTVSVGLNLVNVYIIYLSRLEPQIVASAPPSETSLPFELSPDVVSLSFSTKLDLGQLTGVSGLFSIDSSFNTSVNVTPSHISLAPDRSTVRINTSSYLTGKKIYTIIAKPGIKSDQGFLKVKPDMWSIHLDDYSETGVAGAAATAHGALLGLTGDDHSHYLTTGRSNIWITGNISFTGHTGDASIHFAQGQITGLIPTSVFAGHTGDFNNPHVVTAAQVGSPTIGAFTGHTGDTSIHFTQAQISIPSTQISDFTESVQDVVGSPSFLLYGSGIAGTYSDAGNTLTISGRFASTTGHGVAQFNPASFSVLNGIVSFTGTAVVSGYAAEAAFTGHTGDLSIHFTQGQITGLVATSLFTAHTSDATIHFTQGQITGLTPSSLFVGHTGDFNNPHIVTAAQVGSPTTAQFTGHTGDASIHFTQASISITSSQVSDLTEVTQDTIGSSITGLNGVTGIYNDTQNTFFVSGINSSATAKGVASFSDTAHFSVISGDVSLVTSALVTDVYAVAGIPSLLYGSIGFSGAGDVVVSQGANFLIFSGAGISSLKTEPYIVYSGSSILSAERILTGGQGLSTTVNATNVILAVSGSLISNITGLTGHTGDLSIHFTQGEITGLVATSLFAAHTGNFNNPHNITGGQISDLTEYIQDTVGYTGFFSGQSGIIVQYNDTNNTLAVGLSGDLHTFLQRMPRTIYSSGNIHVSGRTAFIPVPLFHVTVPANTMNLYGVVEIQAMGLAYNITGGTNSLRIYQSGIHHTGWGDGYTLTGNDVYPYPFSYYCMFANSGSLSGNYMQGNLVLGSAQKGDVTGLGNANSVTSNGFVSSFTGLNLDTTTDLVLSTSNYWNPSHKSAYIKIFNVQAIYYPGMT